jgi:hypothetical protein
MLPCVWVLFDGVKDNVESEVLGVASSGVTGRLCLFALRDGHSGKAGCGEEGMSGFWFEGHLLVDNVLLRPCIPVNLELRSLGKNAGVGEVEQCSAVAGVAVREYAFEREGE